MSKVSTLLPCLLGFVYFGNSEAQLFPWRRRPKPSRICSSKTVQYSEEVLNILGTTPYSVVNGLQDYKYFGLSIGSITELIAEASDATATSTPIIDGKSGNTKFPHGSLKPIATYGERSVCDGSRDQKLAGVPDGVGAYLSDDKTVRIVVQSESYGPIFGPNQQSWPFEVNNGTLITGSHVVHIDYDRELMSQFMSSNKPASSMVVGFGQMFDTAYNLKGQKIGKRNRTSANAISAAPMFSNTDKDGVWKVATPITNEADWFYQSFCSAHLEQKYQWGDKIGLADDIWMTNEEWNNYSPGFFVGLSAHVIDIQNKAIHATGVFSNGGFEKIFELNPQHPDYVIFGVAGYNGDFGTNIRETLAERIKVFGPKPDGTNYTWTENVVPFRIYVGVKGKKEDGSAADPSDFLARNGLRYGQLYGYAIDMTAGGPTQGRFRDAFHVSTDANNGKQIPGKWIRQPWRWSGEVKNFEYDGAWDYQLPTGVTNYSWWNAGSLSRSGCKTEHGSPDPRAGITGFVQGSTCGYFGHLYVDDVVAKLTAAAGGFPSEFPGRYFVYQGERDVVNQIELGGAGILAGGRDSKKNWDIDGYGSTGQGTGKVTFEDIDGLEVIVDSTGSLYAIIQEDSTSILGDRMLITKLEHEADAKELKYYYIAMAGGAKNSRIEARVGIPAGTGSTPTAHEFSGIFDLSGLLYKENGKFVVTAASTGKAKRDSDAKVAINDKLIVTNLQSHSMSAGIIEGFRNDRGGQIYLYRPTIPV